MRRFGFRWAALGGLAALLTAAVSLVVPAPPHGGAPTAPTPTAPPTASTPAAPKTFAIGLWGDLPYAKENNSQQVGPMIADMNAANLAFTVYDGDTKDG